MATRRHGKELENAILQAAWSLFTENGYAAVTMQQVAETAGTSKPVLYRRWKNRDALLGDAISYGLRALPLTTPNTGSLRGDLLVFMNDINDTLVGLTAAMTVHLATHFDATGTSPADLHAELLVTKFRPMQELLDRAIGRNEIDKSRLTPRITAMPLDLMRAEIITTMRPLARETIEEIVDTMFLPLVAPDAT